LWEFDTRKAQWQRLESDDGTSGFDTSARRPSGRVLPAWDEVDGKFYLFGGLSVMSVGWQFRLMNDFWSFDPGRRKWELLEPDDQRNLKTSTQVEGRRPRTLAAMGACVIDKTIYFFGGWGGHTNKVVLSGQLWSFQTDRREWELLGNGDAPKDRWPRKRYCPAVVSWQDKLYLWGGRDTEDRWPPQFYNDLWTFDTKTGGWERIHKNGQAGPTARYGMGHARIGHHWYIFGGFGNETGSAPQLNDLWRVNLSTGVWTEIQPDDGSKDVSATTKRPSIRRVPAMTALGKSAYVFGGLDLASGPKHKEPLIAYNDLWEGAS
jgi:N-acetylneuraminic acid mutarotase